ncbi:MAG TPA: SDR family NAD(P)-dependent oxidoreductase [Hypericibacter adhaerens]|uniref:SDR family NAD(P)-dependent oxidoreductase n=1 Tax=Hypericibacter adhaerens TaxID=2602016 RepID=UPI002B5132E8|nr:SDR family NAD(P)-dependent oxidoreductase [Hypericibacter adhaerens]HWA41894.1 SDR family NAD(P)-dependent oxidoreductase [Hypericibacter adhaerens]
MTAADLPGVTVITGASEGIGRSLALELARRGEAVALLARRKPLLDEAVAEIAKAGGRAIAVPCDVTEREAVRAAIAGIEQSFGPVERIIANAGGGKRAPGAALDAAAIEATMRLNYMGTVHTIEAALPFMLARRRGHLVIMSSLAALLGLPGAAGYSAAKAAVARLGESLQIDLAPHGIDVTLLYPGFVDKGGKKKRRPLAMSLARMTRRTADAIQARRRCSLYPASLRLLLALVRGLPAGLRVSLLSRFAKKG